MLCQTCSGGCEDGRVRITFKHVKEETPLRIGPDLALGLPMRAHIVDPIQLDGIAVVDMTIELVDGILQATDVHVKAKNGNAVTSTLLHSVPVKEMTQTLVSHRLQEVLRDEVEDGYIATRAFSMTEDQREKIRLQGPTRESLQAAANIYELARVLGLPPARQVEKELKMPRTTASQWIRRAREDGLLNDGRS